MPLFRYADDLAFTAPDLGTANTMKNDLIEMCQAAGTPVATEGDKGPQLCTLSRGEKTNWLGYEIALDDRTVHFRISQRRWDTLGVALQLCFEAPGSSITHARAVVQGWIGAAGPCHREAELDAGINVLLNTLNDLSLGDATDAGEIKGWWKDAYDRWCHLTSVFSVASPPTQPSNTWCDALPLNMPISEDNSPF